MLGRFKDWDPAVLNSVWKPGRDPRTCDTAWTLARVTQNAVPLLTAYLARIEKEPGASPEFLLGYERAIASALEARGHYDEADQFLRTRLKIRVADDDSKEAVRRRQTLLARIAELYAPTRPAAAERILNGLVAEREAVAARTFAEFRNQPKGGQVWAYGKAWYDFGVLAARYNLLEPYYVQVGRLDAAAGNVLATLWPVSDKATALFMQRFYVRLTAGDAPQVALRTVQRAFVAESEWRDPVYWAPFVLTGR